MESVYLYVCLRMEPLKEKPTFEAACVCENVIMEGQGVPSLIRILDRIEVAIPDNLPPGIPPGFPIKTFIRFKAAADLTGSAIISSRVTKPDGTVGASMNTEIALTAGVNRGIQVISEIQIISPQAGFYHFSFYWNDEFVVSIPLEVRIKQTPSGALTSNQPVANSS
jgi:hypothetical protein